MSRHWGYEGLQLCCAKLHSDQNEPCQGLWVFFHRKSTNYRTAFINVLVLCGESAAVSDHKKQRNIQNRWKGDQNGRNKKNNNNPVPPLLININSPRGECVKLPSPALKETPANNTTRTDVILQVYLQLK